MFVCFPQIVMTPISLQRLRSLRSCRAFFHQSLVAAFGCAEREILRSPRRPKARPFLNSFNRGPFCRILFTLLLMKMCKHGFGLEFVCLFCSAFLEFRNLKGRLCFGLPILHKTINGMESLLNYSPTGHVFSYGISKAMVLPRLRHNLQIEYVLTPKKQVRLSSIRVVIFKGTLRVKLYRYDFYWTIPVGSHHGQKTHRKRRNPRGMSKSCRSSEMVLASKKSMICWKALGRHLASDCSLEVPHLSI